MSQQGCGERCPPKRRKVRAVAGLHRHETASLGARASLITGTGSEHARLLRLVLLSYTRWPGQTAHSPWPSNATLASRTRLTERQVERALVALREAGVVSTRIGKRAGARRVVGRLIDVELHAPCKALAPEGFDVGNLWTLGRSLRARPAALVTAMVGAYMLASDAAGAPLSEWSELGCSMADWRRFVGHSSNASWTKRVRELEGLGLLRREGRRVFVSPPRAWFGLVVEHAERVVVRPAAQRSRPALQLAPSPSPSPSSPSPSPSPQQPALASLAPPPSRSPSPYLPAPARLNRVACEVVVGQTGTDGGPRRYRRERGPP